MKKQNRCLLSFIITNQVLLLLLILKDNSLIAEHYYYLSEMFSGVSLIISIAVVVECIIFPIFYYLDKKREKDSSLNTMVFAIAAIAFISNILTAFLY